MEKFWRKGTWESKTQNLSLIHNFEIQYDYKDIYELVPHAYIYIPCNMLLLLGIPLQI